MAERLVAPEDLKTQGSVKVPAGLQEVSFQLEPDRVVGGRLVPGDHVGVFVSMENGRPRGKADKETTQLTVRKALVTAVQRAPRGHAAAEPAPTASAEPPIRGTRPFPIGSLMLTVAVNDVDAAKIIFASEYAKIWLSKEPLDATGQRTPRSSSGVGLQVSRFVLITPNADFDSRLRQAVAGGLQGGVQTFFTNVLPAGPYELFAQLNQEQPEVLILGPDVPVDEALRLATVLDVQAPGPERSPGQRA